MTMSFEHSKMVMIGNPGYMIDLLKDYGTVTPVSTSADENLLAISVTVNFRCEDIE